MAAAYTHHQNFRRRLWGAVWYLQAYRVIKWIIQDNCVGYPEAQQEQEVTGPDPVYRSRGFQTKLLYPRTLHHFVLKS